MDAKKVLVVIALVAAVGAVAYFLPLNNPQPKLNVNSRVADMAYLDQYSCPEGRRTVGVIFHSNITINGNPSSNINASMQVYNSDGTELGYPMSLVYNSTSGMWRSGSIFGCAPVGSYYGKVSANTVYNDIELSSSTMTDTFEVSG